MKISYYPGCTLKSKARNFEDSALASLAALGIEVEELDRWNCCGAVYSLTEDDLLHQLGPVRVLIRAQEAGSQQVVTLCSQCYNTLARANRLMREDPEKSHTLNEFMTEEADYRGEVEVVHFLQLIRDRIGWDGLRAAVKTPLEGIRVAPFYGCTLLRPQEVSIDEPGRPKILLDFIAALGATPVDFPAADECCGAYEVLAFPEAARKRTQRVVDSARQSQVDALVLSCPLCEYNIGRQQAELGSPEPELPVYYFSQLLALALGLDEKSCRLELNTEAARAMLQARKLATATGA